MTTPRKKKSVKIRAGILTCSDKGSQGKRKDTAGQVIKKILRKDLHAEIVKYEILPDEKVLISKKLQEWCDEENLCLIITTGGTGIAARDNTPEATMPVLHFEIPGISEMLRLEGYKKTPFAVLSRAVCGIRGKTLIINLPGSEKAVTESLEVLLPIIPHALELLAGKTGHK